MHRPALATIQSCSQTQSPQEHALNSPIEFTDSTALQARRNRFWLIGLIAAALLGWGLAAVISSDPPKAPRTQTVKAPALSAVDGLEHQRTLDAPVPVELYEFALNAFLVPLLDDSVPPRWTDVVVDFTCGPGTSILVDGQPMVRGQVIPVKPFTVSWKMDGCSPFGPDSVELSGGVELVVSHTRTGFSAMVRPDQLKVDSHVGRAWLRGPFKAETSLTVPAPVGRSKKVQPK